MQWAPPVWLPGSTKLADEGSSSANTATSDPPASDDAPGFFNSITAPLCQQLGCTAKRRAPKRSVAAEPAPTRAPTSSSQRPRKAGGKQSGGLVWMNRSLDENYTHMPTPQQPSALPVVPMPLPAPLPPAASMEPVPLPSAGPSRAASFATPAASMSAVTAVPAMPLPSMWQPTYAASGNARMEPHETFAAMRIRGDHRADRSAALSEQRASASERSSTGSGAGLWSNITELFGPTVHMPAIPSSHCAWSVSHVAHRSPRTPCSPLALHPTWQALDELLEQRPSGGSDEDSEQAADLLGAHGGVGYADAAKRCKLSDANDAFASSFFA